MEGQRERGARGRAKRSRKAESERMRRRGQVGRKEGGGGNEERERERERVGGREREEQRQRKKRSARGPVDKLRVLLCFFSRARAGTSKRRRREVIFDYRLDTTILGADQRPTAD